MAEERRQDKSKSQYRDNLIRKLFRDEERAIELCNAITGSSYSVNTNITLCDLDNSLTKRFNDLAFAIDDQLLLMIEHQSVISPNMPLRLLSYVTEVLYTWFVQVKELYKKKLHQIPNPKLYVLYNGDEPLKLNQLKLSDAFYIQGEEASLELTVEIIDVNYQSGHEVLQRSESLQGYAYLIDQIRAHMKAGYSRDEAIGISIELCIMEGVLSEFLKIHYEEVAKMLNFQYDQEVEYQAIREEEREEGYEAGASEKAIEMAGNSLKAGLSTELVAELTGLSLEKVTSL